ncbi:uncharacterized protein IWZ02DRAFT_100711 [Phyllosticta citriasiana]|uniref:uncharacterized protein n=1 Tax=Phyllosticta citriasiana TaxID=595635 RepID=UPI0030FD5A84
MGFLVFSLSLRQSQSCAVSRHLAPFEQKCLVGELQVTSFGHIFLFPFNLFKITTATGKCWRDTVCTGPASAHSQVNGRIHLCAPSRTVSPKSILSLESEMSYLAILDQYCSALRLQLWSSILASRLAASCRWSSRAAGTARAR